MSSNYRQKCLNAKGEQCDDCGSAEAVLVHHIDGDRSNNDLENLVPLCYRCHATRHAGHERTVDDAILDTLAGGRATRGALIDWTEYSESAISNRLRPLRIKGAIRRVHERTALYELVEDPRE